MKAVQAAISGMLPGPFAYAESWDEAAKAYRGVAIDRSAHVPVVVDSESIIITSDVALAFASADKFVPSGEPRPPDDADHPGGGDASDADSPGANDVEKLPTRFLGTVMISAERPAREIHQIVEAIVEQLTTLPGSDVSLRLEIDAEVPAGIDRGKVRTLLENATTLGFIDKTIS